MHLVSLSLQRSHLISATASGNFTAPDSEEVALARGAVIEIVKPVAKGKMSLLYRRDVFGIIRRMEAVRIAGLDRDILIVTSDSGKLTVLQWNIKSHRLEAIFNECFGKSGVRRIVPGEYLACDPKGRCVMVGSPEKMKFCYVLNKDASDRVTINSPLEAHKSKQICFDLCAVDVGYENPVFASLESVYDGSETQGCLMGVAFWELDLGLNHVVKKCTMTLSAPASRVLPVPVTVGDGASGVLVCCENFLTYRKPGHPEMSCALPRRLEMGADKSVIVTQYAVHRLRNFYFFLLQSEFGDLYKVEVSQEGGIIKEIVVKYFDTIPVATTLVVLKNGCLLASSEAGNHATYQFLSLGDDIEDAVCTSLHPHGEAAVVAFKPRSLTHLALVEEVASLAPLVRARTFDCFGVNAPQVFSLCGRGPRSSVRALQHGYTVEEMAANELPGKPTGVWAFKARETDTFDAFIAISFVNATLLLSVSDSVEEVPNSPFVQDTNSLLMKTMEGSSWLQVHSTGIRLVHQLESGSFQANQWLSPGNRRVMSADANSRQIVLSVAGGEVFVFDLETRSHAPTEVGRKSLGSEITGIALPTIRSGRFRENFVAVAGVDASVRILSLDKGRNVLKQLSVLALPQGTQADSIAFCRAKPGSDILTLVAGLENGLVLRLTVDSLTGAISDQRLKYIGPRTVKVERVILVDGDTDESSRVSREAVIAMCTRPWLVHGVNGRILAGPLHYDRLSCCQPFSSDQMVGGFVGAVDNELRIFGITSRLGGDLFAQKVITKCDFTPRHIVSLPSPPLFRQDGTLEPGSSVVSEESPLMLAVIESEHNSYDVETKNEIRAALGQITLTENEDTISTDESQIGTFQAGDGKWASCVKIIHPATGETMSCYPLALDEAAVSACLVYFLEFQEQPCLVVGTIFGMTLRPRSVPMASLKVFAYDSKYELTLLHSTPVEDIPTALCPFQGRLLVGVGNRIRLLSLGKKKLLRKSEFRPLPEECVLIQCYGDRIFLGDVKEGILVLKYFPKESRFRVLCDSSHPSWVTCACLLDYNTIMAADKFGNVYV
ncbi:MAG: hypothetical protein KVP17_002306, partial [Porospora cf. gigantea B]|uniref:uncharacterized protein n=2 Tax=Porospora cf. gigantea B TaxID=2853592 RepID=UPI003571DA66